MISFFDDLDTDLIGIYLEHNRNVCGIESKYVLSETLFAINEPFYMQTEKEALIRDSNNQTISLKRKKSKLNKNNVYSELFTESQKHLINRIIDKVRHSLRQVDINKSDNKSAQQMAEMALKLNNFDEYSETLLCNNNNIAIKSGQFIIPPKCSLMCCEVIKGLKVMQQYYNERKFEVSNKFHIVLDPPWNTNKSVKRKHCYQTDNNRKISQMCKQLYLLIESFPKETEIKIAIWTTNKEKEFVLNEMLSILNLKCTHILIWHKITRSGESVKLRGGLEYLIIASRKPSLTECLNGILVSIPSAIHSHKPPLEELLNNIDLKNCDTIVKNKANTPVVTIPDSAKTQPLSHSIHSSLNGLELYARYLNVGFHSIGFECLKFQSYKLFNLL